LQAGEAQCLGHERLRMRCLQRARRFWASLCRTPSCMHPCHHPRRCKQQLVPVLAPCPVWAPIATDHHIIEIYPTCPVPLYHTVQPVIYFRLVEGPPCDSRSYSSSFSTVHCCDLVPATRSLLAKEVPSMRPAISSNTELACELFFKFFAYRCDLVPVTRSLLAT